MPFHGTIIGVGVAIGIEIDLYYRFFSIPKAIPTPTPKGEAMHYRMRQLIVALALAALPLSAQTFDGYTFVFGNKTAQLYDMDKSIVNEWVTQHKIEGCADLLRDSSIIVSALEPVGWAETDLPLLSGKLMIYNWSGEVIWDFKYSSTDYCPHHDIEPVYRTNDPKEKPTFLIPCYTKTWGDKIVEIRPTGKTTGEVLWEWVGNDHTCDSGGTDRSDLLDKSKGGYGSYASPADAMHVNNISYNRLLDQLVISCKGYNEMIVVDHGTTTPEARGTTGGRYGKGGSLLYRWGCPSNYGAPGSRKFEGQHHCCWVPDTLPGTALQIPGGGNFLAVNNGGRKVMEFTCPGLRNGTYERAAGKAFEPSATLWSYTPAELAGNEGSIQKMPNGNYIICTGGAGSVWGISGGAEKRTTGETGLGSHIYEVNSSGTIVWQLSDFGTSSEGYRYAYGYLGGTANVRSPMRAVAAKMDICPVRSGSNGKTLFTVRNTSNNARVSLVTLAGRELPQSCVPVGECTWEFDGKLSAGTCLVKVISGTSSFCGTMTLLR